MIARELVKAEVEKVQSDYLEMPYKIVKIFAASPKVDNGKLYQISEWKIRKICQAATVCGALCFTSL
ncbi:MAG: hypothetical protein ONB46_11010 [candidate division KSB1 bacterium]|nr:hypothetical protein [candidate division KSB1 bacterium]MDZ7366382.1 hypothetical protein [candidate division KSB1 bacterium]MDZ7404037.1 hypothetical protein [candidate division KSB1 bacterium]